MKKEGKDERGQTEGNSALHGNNTNVAVVFQNVQL